MPMLDLSMLGGSPPFSGLLNLPASQGFPVAPKQDDPQAIWDQIEEENRKNNISADRRNAAGMKRDLIAPTYPLPAPDQSAPGISMAMGQAPADFGAYGSPSFTASPFGSLAPILPQAESPAPAVASQPATPAPSIPLPQPRPVSAPQPEEAAIPANAQPTQGQAPTSGDEPSVPGSSLFGRLQKGVSDNSNLLLGLASGFAGAPSFGTGMSRGFANAIPAGQLDTKAQQFALTQGTAKATYQALVLAGAPQQQALVAAFNPDSAISKKLIDSYIGDRKSEIKTVKTKDAFGNETERMYAVNPYDYSSKEITPGGTQSAAGGTNAVLAQGVPAVDQTKVGDDYLSQFSPEVQAGVKAYMRGDALPTGRQQLAQTIKMIAQKYGEDTGVPANDQAYYQKKNFVTSLGNTNSGVGMQVKGFQQGLEHMTELAGKLEKLENVNGLGIAPLAHGLNAVRGMSTAQGDVRKGVDASAQALAGEIGKLYSGSSGGGVHERQATKDLFGKDLSGPELAGALESTLELMRGGLRTIEQRRDDIFGAEGKNVKGANFLGPEQEKAIEKIQSTINRLRGGEAAPAAGGAPVPLAPGASTVINGVTIRRIN